MKQSRTYHFPGCRMIYDADTGDVLTVYDDGAQCRVWPNEEDEKHGKALKIGAKRHKILHEIGHLSLALAMGRTTCPIVYAQAHNQPMPDDAQYLEQMIMAISYAALRVPMPYEDWWQRLGWIARYTNPYALASKVHLLYA